MSDVSVADHLRATTAALNEASDRLSAAWLVTGKDDRLEIDFAKKLVSEAVGLVNTARRQAVRTDPVPASSNETDKGQS